MTRTDLQIFYTALAYLATHMKESREETHEAVPAIILAADMEEYVRKNVQNAFPPNEIRFVNDFGVDEIDLAIDHHTAELRDTENTILPQDKITLIKFYDRLQQRRSRRMNSTFYEMVDVEILANKVLHYIEEEIRMQGADT